jgi:hypothetical protein
MKITKPELFRNALKIILVGTGNVLSPHEYFQFERTLKNVVVNSESTLWIFFWRHLFWIFQKASRRGFGARHLMGGDPQGWPAKMVELHGAPHGPPIWHIPFYERDIPRAFWYFGISSLSLG